MTNLRQFDYIIVGLGLAGTCLAHTLEDKYKKRILVVDRDSGAKCSNIAAGTFNPLGFRTFTPTWNASIFISFLKNFYGNFFTDKGLKLIENRPIFKILKGENQRSMWLEKTSQQDSSEFMNLEILELIDGVKQNNGIASVKEAGNIKMKELLSNYRAQLIQKESLLEELFDYNLLEMNDQEINYKSFSAPKIVFCQGHEYNSNPFFKDLPFRLTKGEVIIIRVKNWNPPGIIHNNINIVPLGGEIFWVGSTFNWDDLTLNATQTAKDKLIAQLKETLSVDFDVIDHWTGIRPTVIDRRPILGNHPTYKKLYIFNGLGSRGVMLAPFFANQMADYLEKEMALDPEVDIKRFTGLT